MTIEGNDSSGGGDGMLAKRYYHQSGMETLVTAVYNRLSSYYSKAKSLVYDTLILRMTEKWYRAVLLQVKDGSIILDVGVGTGGALLRCADIIISKNLYIVGIDIDTAYVESGKVAILASNISNRVSIDQVDVYDGKEKLLDLVTKLVNNGGGDDGVTRMNKNASASNGQFVDAVYFSGSFSLLPDPVKALRLVSTFVITDKGQNNNNTEPKVYITQTYQRHTPFFLPYIKPLLKYATTIDFGQLVKEEDVLQTFKESGLEVVEHGVIPNSIDNRFQAAYLSILR
jgi:ubiquinone/menaquinone biosynthesis C-methylase UbiE